MASDLRQHHAAQLVVLVDHGQPAAVEGREVLHHRRNLVAQARCGGEQQGVGLSRTLSAPLYTPSSGTRRSLIRGSAFSNPGTKA